MFEFTFGEVGSGKSLYQADKVLWLLHRSRRIEKKYKLPKREIWCNFHMSKKIEEKCKDILHYWKFPQEMIFKDYPMNKIKRTGFDCVWDEMAVEIPSDKWKDTDMAVRKFFAQHRKRGIQIFGNTQDYMMLDINARRMATRVRKCQKLIGNRDPSPTLPPIKFIWGIVLIWEIDKQCIRADDQDQKHAELLPEFLPITRELCEAYDTSEDIDKQEIGQLVHLEWKCPTCNKLECAHKKI